MSIGQTVAPTIISVRAVAFLESERKRYACVLHWTSPWKAEELKRAPATGRLSHLKGKPFAEGMRRYEGVCFPAPFRISAPVILPLNVANTRQMCHKSVMNWVYAFL
jgi:hypothetical protein